MKYCVYICLCEKKHLYVGQTKLWRLQKRWDEHVEGGTTKWTNKYRVVEKLASFECQDRAHATILENAICEQLMRKFGLDSCRGGKWNMDTEGPDTKWWPPKRLQGIPCFTKLWFSHDAHTFSGFSRCGQIRSEVQPLVECFSHSRERTPLIHVQA